MNRCLPVVLAVLVAACAFDARAQAPRHIVAEKSQIRFVTRQMNVAVEGAFRKFDATVAFDPAKPEATQAKFEVDLGSIDLGSAEGETEARRKPWLNVEAFPKASFVSTALKPAGTPGKFIADGNLTIRGTTQKIAVPITISEAAGLRVVEGQFPLKRLQFTIGEGAWSDTDTVADEVLVRFRFALTAQ